MHRHTDSSTIASAGMRAGSPVLEAYQERSVIPAGSPPVRQSGNPLAATSFLGTGRSRKGPNLVSKAGAEVL
jgi:hypothetical protein